MEFFSLLQMNLREAVKIFLCKIFIDVYHFRFSLKFRSFFMATFPSFISLDPTADTPVIKSFDDPKHVYCMNPTEEQSKTSGAASTVLASSYPSTFPTTSVRERTPSFFRVESPLEKHATGSTIPSPKPRTYTSVVQSVDKGGSEDDPVKKAETRSPSHSESEGTSSVFWVEIRMIL